MNCWKSFNFNKEFGLTRIYSLSLLIGIAAFICLYVPLSFIHGTPSINKNGMILFGILFIILPFVHSFMHILPLIITNKRTNMKIKIKKIILPALTYFPTARISKQLSIWVALAPTILITVPGIIASYVTDDYYLPIVLITAFHIGVSFSDFIYMIHLHKAPKKSLIENENGAYAILVNAQD
ncbi:DUF3267 domain-containing protein [Lentibacillus daqui]|uniref:DUF3267 domain-containing protein n=1 Tax=Lentibacillus daqui TaxID=2911514 RepID=UPI0022B1C00F|nr:DUF3267 domain-containing protein [Lentibacillus daqui]